YGPSAVNLPYNVSVAKVDHYLFRNINSYWSSWIQRDKTEFMKTWKLLLIPGIAEWVVLGMARQLYTLETGEITSKSRAGYYCISQLPCDFLPIFNEVLENRKAKKSFPVLKSYSVSFSISRAKKVIKVCSYILDQFNTRYDEKYNQQIARLYE
ncbi:MAG: DUF4111 domain-containing protein, partial [Bacteroidota bacterium]|nr:DUF4111 domain-containing protein [Bacteroidota bacterium]